MPRGPEFLAALLLAAAPASGQVVGECGDIGSISHVAEPWDANTRFESGLRLVRLDTADGGLGSQHLAIITGVAEEMGGTCFVFSRGGDDGSMVGWGSIDLGGVSVEAGGDAMVVTVPVSQWNTEADKMEAHLFRLRIGVRDAFAEVIE